ncbi:MAG: MmcB family DNA repair protein [Rhodospirillaceae bacterium]|nr:MmcB family DNA repair protein [Rhodospirillaceae bacterium]
MPPNLPSVRPFADAAVLARGVCRAFGEAGFSCLTEFRLANGRRADVMAMDRRGRFAIVEIKSSEADFRSDAKWPDYLDFCDLFYFAVAEDFPRELLPEDHGLMIADAYGAAVLRPSPEAPLHAGRRKAVMLRFAHGAARQVRQLVDPGI